MDQNYPIFGPALMGQSPLVVNSSDTITGMFGIRTLHHLRQECKHYLPDEKTLSL